MQLRYGSDKNGLICGFLFAGEGAGVPVDLEAAQAWLATPQPGFVWLHFNLADASAEG